MARWFGITQPQLSRIENGSPTVHLDRLAAWAELLGIPEHLLWFRLPAGDTQIPVSRPLLLRRPSVAAAGPPFALPQLPGELVPAGTSDLAAVQSLRVADSQIGGGYLYAAVTGYLQHTVAPRLFGTAALTDEPTVFTAAAGLTEMAGWMAHDAGRDALADQHFQRALGLATAGKDHQLSGHILASLSHLAHHTKRSEQAIAYARQGHDRLQAGQPHPGVAAKLFAMQARGHAALGQADPCREQLRHAERVLDSSAAEPRSPWVSQFDEASLAAEAARCFRQLGQLDAARRQAEQVVELRPRERARSRAFAQLMLISILIAQGRPDEACAVAYDVLDATRALGSYLVVRQFEDLAERFAPYERAREVAAFLDCLREELRERRWLAHWLPSTDPHPNGVATQ